MVYVKRQNVAHLKWKRVESKLKTEAFQWRKKILKWKRHLYKNQIHWRESLSTRLVRIKIIYYSIYAFYLYLWNSETPTTLETVWVNNWQFVISTTNSHATIRGLIRFSLSKYLERRVCVLTRQLPTSPIFWKDIYFIYTILTS